jgi:uncharacterized cupredoxin-like copper-binding protein
MPRHRIAIAALAVAIAVGTTACAGTGSPTPGWTYGPTFGAAATAAPTATATPAPTPAPTQDTGIALTEWKVAVASNFKAGSTTFTIANNGTIPHELLVFKSDLAPSAYPTDAAGDIVEDGPGVVLVSDGENVDPNGSQSRTVDLAPGTYLFVCNIPGHFKAGMFTVVTVTQ